MTDEGKKQLDEFLKAKEKYTIKKFEFEKFAKETSPSYKRICTLKEISLILALAFLITFFYFGKRNDVVAILAMLGFFACCLTFSFARPKYEEVWDLTLDYLEHKKYLQEEAELAFRVFRGETVFSDLPVIENMLAMNLIDAADIDELDIDFDFDFDFDD